MSYEVISIKVDPVTKKEAKRIAEKIGLSLSAVLKGFLKQFIRTKTVTFSDRDEVPNEYLKQVIYQAEKDLKAGKGSPIFENVEDAITWLHRDE